MADTFPNTVFMSNVFEVFNLPKPLFKALDESGFREPTPIQVETYPVICSGSDMVGIAQTGTGKTHAYLLPLLKDLKFSKQLNPRILILVPTRELVLQVCEMAENLCKYQNIRVLGVFGGVNINTQKLKVESGCDILVGTPGRLYDLGVSGVLKLKGIGKLVIDEVDVMLDLGFRRQLTNIFEMLPERRQNLMFSATMTEEVDELITEYFAQAKRIAIALSGTPLASIAQECFAVPNFLSKAALLKHLLADRREFKKVLVFVTSKRLADRLFQELEDPFLAEMGIIHSNKSQNYRIRSIEEFDQGKNRIIIATDIMARGLDLEQVTHVINFDTPLYPENYIHRIGRTGRASHFGKSILFYTEKEAGQKAAIEALMDYSIPEKAFPEEVSVVSDLIPEEREEKGVRTSLNRNEILKITPGAFHEKKEKNKKVNQGGSYKRKLAAKYKKPKTRGDKGVNKKRK